eukprot:6269612-Prymnesium_polylepis.1
MPYRVSAATRYSASEGPRAGGRETQHPAVGTRLHCSAPAALVRVLIAWKVRVRQWAACTTQACTTRTAR